MSVPVPDKSGVHKRPRPVERFLGPDEAKGGPFALLGVGPAACTDNLVLSALDRQIERIDKHPECDTPEADEVRLALHAAAAQLLDPVVKRHLIARWSSGPHAPAAVPSPGTQVVEPVAGERLLEADAILTLGLFGGWNQRALRRLVSLARARGLSADAVAATLRNIGGRRSRSRMHVATHAPKPEGRTAGVPTHLPAVAVPAPQRARQDSPIVRPGGLAPDEPRVERVDRRRKEEPLDEQVDPGAVILRNALVFGAVGLVGLCGVFALILVLTSGPAAPTTPPPAPAAAGATGATGATGAAVIAATAPAPAPVKPTPAPAGAPVDLAGIARELAACAAAAGTEPAEATARFERVARELAANWVRIPRDRLVACHDAVIEFMYKVSGSSELSMRAVNAVAGGAIALGSAAGLGAAEVEPAAWSCGMLVRLSREKDLPAGVKSGIDAAITAGLGQSHAATEQTFDAGATAALYEIPSRLTPSAVKGGSADVDQDAWKRWCDAVAALGASDPKLRTRLLLAGVEALLISAPEPNVNRGVQEAITEVMLRLTWRPEDESRRWLLRWFDDRRVTAADLHAVTSVLATRSAADGVDLTMVLSTSAADKVRADLRDRYANVWGTNPSINRDELTGAWVKAAREAINNSYAAGDELEEMKQAVILARLNEAAMWQWRGEGGEAAKLVADGAAPVDQAMVSSQANPTSLKLMLTDGGWGEKYLAARQNAKVRKEMLDQLLTTAGDLGSVDAEIVVNEAMFGSPADVRGAAVEAIKHFSFSPAVLNGLLEKLPRMPRTTANAALIEYLCQRQLPALKAPEWPIEARRLLVERLLEAIAAESPRAVIDRLAGLMSASYKSMSAPAPLAADQRAAMILPPTGATTGQLWQRWRTASESVVPTTPPPYSLDQIERRRAGRLSQARGMVQAFAADQASLCELMAYVVNAEQPARSDQIKLTLSNLSEERRRATGIIDQIRAAERAMTQLWLIRFQEEAT